MRRNTAAIQKVFIRRTKLTCSVSKRRNQILHLSVYLALPFDSAKKIPVQNDFGPGFNYFNRISRLY